MADRITVVVPVYKVKEFLHKCLDSIVNQAFIDPDDWLELDCCNKVLKVTEKNAADLIYFQRDINNEDGMVEKGFPQIGPH